VAQHIFSLPDGSIGKTGWKPDNNQFQLEDPILNQCSKFGWNFEQNLEFWSEGATKIQDICTFFSVIP